MSVSSAVPGSTATATDARLDHGVIAFLIAEHRRTTDALISANARLADAVETQGKALDGVRALLASQGYTLPPLEGPQ